MKKKFGLGIGVLSLLLIWFVSYFIMPVLNIKFLFNALIILATIILLIPAIYYSSKKDNVNDEENIKKNKKTAKTLLNLLI